MGTKTVVLTWLQQMSAYCAGAHCYCYLNAFTPTRRQGVPARAPAQTLIFRERAGTPKRGRHSTVFVPPNASVQWQPDGLTIDTNKWFLGAGFPGAPPIFLISAARGRPATAARATRKARWLALTLTQTLLIPT